MRNIVLVKSTLFLLMLISVSANAQTVYDARRQLMNSIVTQSCNAFAQMGDVIAQANGKGIRRATVKAKLAKAPDAQGQPFENNPDALNLIYAITDAVYAQGAKTSEEGEVIGRQVCTQTLTAEE
jgi:hypothetical protein